MARNVQELFDISDILPEVDWSVPDPTIDPRHHHTPSDGRVFVFGSNWHGVHGGGAAWYAHSQLGAEWGVAEGPTGRTYALPTCFEPGLPVDIRSLEEAVGRFLEHAEAYPDVRFFVSEVGCGLAGFYVHEVARLFADAPPNCDLPVGWREDTYMCLCDTCAPVGP